MPNNEFSNPGSSMNLCKLLIITVLLGTSTSQADEATYNSIEALGKALYFDVNISFNRSQSCSSCHLPESGFSDPRQNLSDKAFSLGDDGRSLGDRNAPSVAYAVYSPDFHKNAQGKYIGGQFLDGREKDLQGQAGGPLLNPIEMGMPDKASVVARLMENSNYVTAFTNLFGTQVFEEAESAYDAMTKSIAAFEKTDYFSPFDSKYDRYLRGEYRMTKQEELGMTLFFSQQFTNCNLCHQLQKLPESKGETFTNYEYHNIGVPTNIAGRKANGLPVDLKDEGLFANPAVHDKAQSGKFKVPTLRNVAITGPYMHNGVFKDLKTVILFYNKYNTKSSSRQINPETGALWLKPEIDKNISIKELETGPALSNKRINALIAFMMTLTDQRYEHLL
ncbi:MAG: cytochrome c peroxidase [Candidatus Thiodiazotropha sp. LLP2]